MSFARLDRNLVRKMSRVQREVYVQILLDIEFDGDAVGWLLGGAGKIAKGANMDRSQVRRALEKLAEIKAIEWAKRCPLLCPPFGPRLCPHLYPRLKPLMADGSDVFRPAQSPTQSPTRSREPAPIPELQNAERKEKGAKAPSATKPKPDFAALIESTLERLNGSRGKAEELIAIMHGQRASGTAKDSAVWRQLMARIDQAITGERLTDAQWSHGFDAAIRAEVPNPTYVLKAARGWRGEPNARKDNRSPNRTVSRWSEADLVRFGPGAKGDDEPG